MSSSTSSKPPPPPPQPMLVLLSSSCVAADKHKAIASAFNDDDGIRILMETLVLLNEEQQTALPIENAEEFCAGSIAAYLLQSTAVAIDSIDFDGMQKANKLHDTDIFTTTDSFFLAKLKQFIFPQKPAMEQSLLLCQGLLSPAQATEIVEELKLKGIFVLFKGNITHDDAYCIAFLCESFGCIDALTLMIGCDDMAQCEQYAPTAWNFRFQNDGYKFTQVSNVAKIESAIPTLPVERTLALIKPTAVSKEYAAEIIAEIKQYGFTIISQKKVHLNLEQAQQFYKEHNGKPFFNALATFMSSGPIFALVLERVAAIQCWRTLLGPTNTFKAQENAPQSLRARYGTDQTANACHGSDSTSSAQREIRFYFPELGINMRTAAAAGVISGKNLVEDYMSQQLSNGEPLKDFLIRGLCELAKQKPSSNNLQVVEWFGNWLLDHNPNKPKIDEPSESADKETASFVEQCQAVNGNKDVEVVFILGGPGSGKGTQCQRIAEKYGYVQLSTGDLFRAVVSDESNALGQRIKQIMADGALVPTTLVLDLLKQEMVRQKHCRYLLDGFPRSVEQAILFEQQLIACKTAIYFDCEDAILTERCLGRAQESNRVDDNAETIAKRLVTFHEETDPTVEYLKNLGNVKQVDATQGVEEVWKNVETIMNSI